jgi:hypothetical protein
MLERVSIAVIGVVLWPIATAIAAIQTADPLFNDEGIIRFFIYVGSVALGGYLVFWLTRTVYPQLRQDLKDGFSSIVSAIKDHEISSLNRTSQIIDHVDNHTHKE